MKGKYKAPILIKWQPCKFNFVEWPSQFLKIVTRCSISFLAAFFVKSPFPRETIILIVMVTSLKCWDHDQGRVELYSKENRVKFVHKLLCLQPIHLDTDFVSSNMRAFGYNQALTIHLTFFFTILFFTDAEEMMRRLDRLESQLSSAANIADNNTKQQLPLQSIIQLLENRQFHKLLDIHNIIQTVQCFQCPPTPLCCDAKVLVREVRNKRVLYKFYYCW